MVVERLVAYRNRVRVELEAIASEEAATHDVAASFAFGAFVTLLPTLGTGLLVLAAAVAISERANAPAMFASVVVFNPFVKWGVYAGSFSLGSLLLGPVPDVTVTQVSLSAGPDVLARLLLGNLLLAVVGSICCYVLVDRFARRFRRRNSDLDELVPDSLSR
jgi:uncharacterized protein (DUF2062 family)